MARVAQRGEWIQLEMSMNLPPLERVHRRQVKKRAEMLWDELQRRQRSQRNSLGASGKT
ncbi:MAG: hypothetical protein AAF571_06335 [Verrucomicrobiota bacterium]